MSRGLGSSATPLGNLTTSDNIIKKIELYINNIFVNPEIHDIFIKRIGFSLIRVHREQSFSCSNSTDELLLQQLKWPIETLFVGMRMEDYNSSSEAVRRDNLDKWMAFSQISTVTQTLQGFDTQKKSTLTGTSVTFTLVGATVTGLGTAFDTELLPGDFLVINGIPYVVDYAAGIAAAALTLSADQSLPAVAAFTTTDFYKITKTPVAYDVSVYNKTMNSVSITAHGIALYSDFPAAFYSAYLIYQFGGMNINTPKDSGVLMIPFNLYPGSLICLANFQFQSAKLAMVGANKEMRNREIPRVLCKNLIKSA